jgi:L-ascorbate metabolism protein UlaG (beta-lactamase superfamily)
VQVRWYGQSAFALAAEADSVFIDPFGDMESARKRGMTWNYPAIADAAADLLLVTHEHGDHNAVDAIHGVKQTIRSSAGTVDTQLGPLVGIASEHDAFAGTKRGANVIFVFEIGGVRVCHMGDFGQAELRPEQLTAIGKIDLLFIPLAGWPPSMAEWPRTWSSCSLHRGPSRCTTGRRRSRSSNRSMGFFLPSRARW